MNCHTSGQDDIVKILIVQSIILSKKKQFNYTLKVDGQNNKNKNKNQNDKINKQQKLNLSKNKK